MEVLRIPDRIGPDDGSGEIIQVHDAFYILATSGSVDDRTRVLKHGESFAVFDRRGDIRNVGRGEQGHYVRGTHFLSRFELSLSGERLLLLGSAVRYGAPVLAVDLINPDIRRAGAIVLQRGVLHVTRINTLREGAFEEQIEITNFDLAPAAFTLRIAADADFADIFEVRGFRRERRGRSFDRALDGGALVLAYVGLDGVERRTRITCEPDARIVEGDLVLDVQLAPHGKQRCARLAGDRESAAPITERTRATRLEGFERFRFPRRWPARGRVDRALRGAGLRASRQARSGASRERARRATHCPKARARSGPTGRALRSRLLVCGARDLRAGSRRQRGTVPCAHVERGAVSICADRRARARRTHRCGAARVGAVLGLGRAHARELGAALQPDVVPQRLRMAPRQRDDRTRPRALRPARRGAPAVERLLRRQPLHRAAPHARVDLRVRAALRSRPDGLPAGVHAAVLVGRGGLRNAAGRAGSLGLRDAARDLLRSPPLPPSLRELSIRDLCVAGARVDLDVSRRGDAIVVSATRRDGNLRIVVAS